MARDPKLLTDEQWKIIEPLLPPAVGSPKGGRKPKGLRLELPWKLIGQAREPLHQLDPGHPFLLEKVQKAMNRPLK